MNPSPNQTLDKSNTIKHQHSDHTRWDFYTQHSCASTHVLHVDQVHVVHCIGEIPNSIFFLQRPCKRSKLGNVGEYHANKASKTQNAAKTRQMKERNSKMCATIRQMRDPNSKMLRIPEKWEVENGWNSNTLQTAGKTTWPRKQNPPKKKTGKTYPKKTCIPLLLVSLDPLLWQMTWFFPILTWEFHPAALRPGKQTKFDVGKSFFKAVKTRPGPCYR